MVCWLQEVHSGGADFADVADCCLWADHGSCCGSCHALVFFDGFDLDNLADKVLGTV